MKTQAIKLSKVLHNGSLRQVKAEELYQEIEDYFNNGEVLGTKEEYFTEIRSNILNRKSCWEFVPYKNIDLPYEKIRQWSENPFTLINTVYGDLL